MSKRASIRATTLRSRSLEYKAALVKAFVEHALPRFQNGTYKTVVYQVFPLGAAKDAHALMEANENTGKLLLTAIHLYYEDGTNVPAKYLERLRREREEAEEALKKEEKNSA